jgi:hypothetical protein
MNEVKYHAGGNVDVMRRNKMTPFYGSVIGMFDICCGVPCCTWSLELVVESIRVFVAENTCRTLEYVCVKMASFEEERPPVTTSFFFLRERVCFIN